MTVEQSSVAFASNPAESRQEIRNYTMNFGPQHPAAHGVLRLSRDDARFATAEGERGGKILQREAR